jgi:hypothetical protein
MKTSWGMKSGVFLLGEEYKKINVAKAYSNLEFLRFDDSENGYYVEICMYSESLKYNWNRGFYVEIRKVYYSDYNVISPLLYELWRLLKYTSFSCIGSFNGIRLLKIIGYLC